MSGELAYLGLAEASELIRAKKLSPVEYATALLARIERLDGKYNAFIALTPERALKAARAVEAEITAGGRLWVTSSGFDNVRLGQVSLTQQTYRRIFPRAARCLEADDGRRQ
jgi:hypothetical protein